MNIKDLDCLYVAGGTDKIYGGRRRRVSTSASTYAGDSLAIADAGADAFGSNTYTEANTATKVSKRRRNTKFLSKQVSTSEASADAIAISSNRSGTHSSRSRSDSDYSDIRIVVTSG